ncbi:hypothetical protein MJD09_18260 [bacterium]|nr:hypothetical protein [bacterium]
MIQASRRKSIRLKGFDYSQAGAYFVTWTYFRKEQGKDTQYIPFIGQDDRPATHLNTEIMTKYRALMRKYYFDPKKYKTYLEQLGITYPMVRESVSEKTN